MRAKPRAALYARVSTRERQETENQLRELRQFARRQGWRIVREYVDRASGGAGPDGRPRFAAMLEAATRKEFDILLFWSIDRLTREGARETLNYLQRLEQYGVRYRSYTQPFFDTAGPFREALISILAALALQERHLTRERVRAGIARARRAGVKFGRPRRVIDARKLYDWYRKPGASLAQIAKRAGISKTTAFRRIRAYGRTMTRSTPK